MHGLVYTLWRHLLAAVAAFTVAAVVFAISVFVTGSLVPSLRLVTVLTLWSIAVILTGFSGVFVGSLSLPPANRRAGSVVLSILGLAAALLFIRSLSAYEQSRVTCWLPMLASGAGVAVLLVWKVTSTAHRELPEDGKSSAVPG